MTPLRFAWRTFAAMSKDELYAALQLRQAVFVLEQRSVYQDLDGRDQAAQHLLARDARGRLVGYARLVPPVFPGRARGPRGDRRVHLGRVVLAPKARGRGLGRALVGEALGRAERLHPSSEIALEAQAHLEEFYRGFGFEAAGAPFDDGGVLHLAMRRPARRRPGRS